MPKRHTDNNMIWEAPVIIIGAGRSGTTLLASALGEHPVLYMIGETSFLLPRLWDSFFSRPEYVENYRLGKLLKKQQRLWDDMLWFEFWEGVLGRNLRNGGDVVNELRARERTRIARALGEMVGKSLIPPELRRPRWGFKEIWNGSPAFRHGWSLYNDAFPEATYVHSVRNPFDFARSCFANQRQHPSEAKVLQLLREWVEMVRMSRQQQKTGRYMEYRYEDLQRAGADKLSEILEFLGLEPREQCYEALRLDYLRATFVPEMPALTTRQIDGVLGLQELIEEFGYTVPKTLLKPTILSRGADGNGNER